MAALRNEQAWPDRDATSNGDVTACVGGLKTEKSPLGRCVDVVTGESRDLLANQCFGELGNDLPHHALNDFARERDDAVDLGRRQTQAQVRDF